MLMLLSENDSSDSQEDKKKTSETVQTSPKIKTFSWSSRSVLYTIMSKEFICLALTLVVYYAMFVTSLTKTNKVSPAQLFFTNSSCVTDFYEGNLAVAMQQGFKSDISIVLLYAPWDADSQLARQEFDVTCRFYSKQIKFLAINCWHPGSTCRNHFTKLTRYPVILIYIQAGQEVHAIQYKGHLHADHIISFVTHVLNPISKIDSASHLSRFKSNNDGLVVLCADLDTALGARLYKVFYSVAVKFLEYDAYREIKFAAVLNSQVSLYVTKVFPSLVLLNFNNSLDYKGNFTEENIIDWILNNLSGKPVSWINLSGSKSVTLNYYLKNETSLVLFTPRNLLRNINIYYNILKIIAADFHKNCRSRGSDAALEADKYQILINYLTINNIVETANHKILAQTCDQLKLRIIEKIIKRRKSLEREQEANLSRTKGFVNETMDKTDGHAFGLNYGTSYVLNVHKETGVLFPLTSSNVNELFNTSTKVTAANTFPSASVGSGKYIDKYSIVNLIYENSKHMCKLLRLANRILGMPDLSVVDGKDSETSYSARKDGVAPDSQPGKRDNFADCATNKSMNFLSIDSKRYRYFLDNLNIDLDSYKDETLAIIVDVVNNNENIYLLNSNITRDSLVLFVKDYLDDKLTRYKRSNDLSEQAKGVVSLNRKFDTIHESTLLELNAWNFLSHTHNSTASVVVLFYSKYCGLCHVYSHTVYLFSHMLSHVRELRFARIDGDTNDLSYPFIPRGFPTLILFPAREAEDSIVFERSERFTQTSLVSFLVRGIRNRELGVHIYLAVCLQTNRNHAYSCLQNINKLIHSYLLNVKLNLYKSYARFPGDSSRVATLQASLNIKKYLVRMKYYRLIQSAVRSLVSRSRSRRKANHVVRCLYNIYTKYNDLVSHLRGVYGRLERSKELPSGQVTYGSQYRVKQEL
ncbi:hypothetical protein M8J76_004626 [Diaphorina citri]|nr:hypothetical protein M8J76_004626 [Diaphorina citri]